MMCGNNFSQTDRRYDVTTRSVSSDSLVPSKNINIKMFGFKMFVFFNLISQDFLLFHEVANSKTINRRKRKSEAAPLYLPYKFTSSKVLLQSVQKYFSSAFISRRILSLEKHLDVWHITSDNQTTSTSAVPIIAFRVLIIIQS